MFILTSFISKVVYTDAWGKSMVAYRVGVRDVGITVLPPDKDFKDFIFQSYPAHFFTYYWMNRFLNLRGVKAFILSSGTSIAWEIYEEKILRTSPVSMGDIVSGVLGGIFAGFIPGGISIEYKFTLSTQAKISYPNTGNPSLDTLIYKLNTNYAPFVVALKKKFGTIQASLAFSYAFGNNIYPYEYPYKPDSIPSIQISTETPLSMVRFGPEPIISNSPFISINITKAF